MRDMKLIIENFNRFLTEKEEKKKLFILVGPPSVGKSYWIEKTFENKPYIISRDDIADEVARNYSAPDGTPWSYDDLFIPPPKGSKLGDIDKNYGRVIRSPPWMRKWQPLSYSKIKKANDVIQQKFVERVGGAVPSGQDIVVDMTNMTTPARLRAMEAIKSEEQDYKKIAVVFEFKDSEEIIKRVAVKRQKDSKKQGKAKTIPLHVIDRMFKSFQEIKDSEGFDEIISVDNREALKLLIDKEAEAKTSDDEV